MREVYKISNFLIIVVLFWELITFRYPLTAKLYKVGHGSAIFLTDGKKSILLDCGSNTINSYLATKILRDLKRNYLWKVDYIFISHLHADHINGIFSLNRRCKIEKLFYSTYSNFSSPLKKKFLKLPFARKIAEDKIFNIGNFQLQVFTQHIRVSDSENNSSLVIKIKGKRGGIFFAGDLEEAGLEEFLHFYKGQFESIFSDLSIVIAPHHGRTSLHLIKDYIKNKVIYMQASIWERRRFSKFFKILAEERGEIKIVNKDLSILF